MQYYKPWQLHSRDEDIIREQITETEQTIAREVADFKTRYPQPPPPPPDYSNEQPTTDKQESATPHTKQTADEITHPSESAPKETGQSNDAEGTVTPAATAATTTHAAPDTVGSETTNKDQSSGDPARTIDKLPTTSTSASTNPDHQHHGHHHHPDDGGEVVEEDKEDTVIY